MAKRMPSMALWLAVVASLVMLAGCSGPKEGGKPAGEKVGGKRRLAGIVFQEDQFFRLVLFGMRSRAKEAGVELLEGNSANKPEKEFDLVNTYVAQGVDAIMISPVSATGSVQSLKAAKAKGIAIVAHNTPIAQGLASAFIECSARNLGVQTGKAARKYIVEKMGGKANIAVIAFRSLIAQQSDDRTNGFKEQIKDLPGVKIVAEQDAWLPEAAVKRATDILTAHPEVNLIWSANEGGTVGSVLAVKNAGKAGKIVVFGTDASEQLLGFVKSPDNILQATTSQKPYDVGRATVETALNVLDHRPVQAHVSMDGILLSREDPSGLSAFEKQLKEWIAQ